ncbi:MAG: iron-dependent repressor [Flavobacteriales bacterium]|nr:iron-dependent repressor [Flavobacteriales bacterium]|tara:strand:- start:7403 stop:8065 length:663 start_codon:yes stop_codon:yes gene_type:complete
MQSSTTEDYLKAIFKLSGPLKKGVSTNAIAEELSTKASSVSDMVKKLSDRKLVHYVKYQGSNLTKEGEKIALRVIRKHRLWEVFLVEKLKFGWDEIHEIAEQLEHIKSSKLIDKLDAHLGFPKSDPHGDPIPDKKGLFPTVKKLNLNELQVGEKAILIGVSEDSKHFLSYLDKIGLKLGSTIEILDFFKFDKSLKVQINNKTELTFSDLVAKNLNISKED